MKECNKSEICKFYHPADARCCANEPSMEDREIDRLEKRVADLSSLLDLSDRRSNYWARLCSSVVLIIQDHQGFIGGVRLGTPTDPSDELLTTLKKLLPSQEERHKKVV
jgi:hypothetical protein